MRSAVLALAVLLALPACADDLRDDPPDDPDDPMDDADPTPSGHITHTDNGDGTTTTVVDARDYEVWIYLDLESKEEKTPNAPETSNGWDLGFQRFEVKVNGGVSGAGGMEVAVLPGEDFDALTRAPSQTYVTDAADGADDNTEPDLVLSSSDDLWYDYDPTTHVLTPKDVVYVIRTVEGNYVKLEVTNYYNDAGTSGYLSFRWGMIDPPPGATSLTVDASNREAFVYLDVTAGALVEVGDPAASDAWDVAISRTMFVTNGGTSGTGLGAARVAGAAYDDVTSSPTTGFESDTMLPVPGPPGSGEFSGNPVLADWFDYDPATHVVSTKGETYFVRTAAGDYSKLTILDYSDGVYQLRVDALPREVATETTVIDASDGAAWVYISFRAGAAVTVDTPEADDSWDLAVSRTRMRTNSGTSGAGTGGALDTGEADLAAVTAAPAAGYAADELVPIPGPPGSGEESGNPTLATWFDYDSTTHVVSPRATSFIVRTADGGYVKLAVTDYADGVLTVAWAYAGAGHDTFGN